MHSCRTTVAFKSCNVPRITLQPLHGRGCAEMQKRRVAAPYRKEISPIESSDSVFASHDPVQHQAAMAFYIQAYKLRHSKQQQRSFGQQFHVNLPDSNVIAQYCPLLATAMLLPVGTLLFAPQQAVQMLAGVSSPAAAVGSLGTCFAQLMGASYLFQVLVTLLASGCVYRGELGSTTCQRMLMATLLPMPAVLLALNKAASSCSGFVGPAVIAVLELSMFTVHVLLHLHHHPWFLLKVFWPLAITMLVTELIPTNWTLTAAGPGPVQAILTALVSVKLFGRLSGVAARFAPALGKHWLLPVVRWLAKHALPQVTSRLAKVLPRLARYVGRLIPRLSRLGARLAGRMAPRYAQDQLVGHTQQWAFPNADGLLTDTVAKSIDLLPPKNRASWTYCGLLVTQLMMVIGAYAPDLLFSSTAAVGAGLAATPLVAEAAAGAAGAVPVAAAALAAKSAAVVTGTAAALVAVLRFMKFSWGAGFFVSAFACNCLKTAADRGHLRKAANRQLNLAIGLLQAATAVVLMIGMERGAVVSNVYAWFLITAAVVGALFCCTQAAAAGLQQGQVLSLAAIAAGSWTPSSSTTASAFGSVHMQQEWQQSSPLAAVHSSATALSADITAAGLAEAIPEDVRAVLQQQAECREMPGQLFDSPLQLSRLPDHLLSSVDWKHGSTTIQTMQQ